MDNKVNISSITMVEKHKNKKIKKYINILSILIGIMLTIFLAVQIFTMSKFINIHVEYEDVYTAEDFEITSEKLKLKTADGLNIIAHEVFVSEPKAVVILISGIHNPSITAFFGHSKMLQENGYASILLELRAHGESEGNVIGLGYKEHLDAKAVVEYIKSNNKYKNVPIVIHGASMGGATAINSFGQIPEIDGLISMSAFSSWEDVFCDTMINMRVPKAFAYMQKPFMKLHTTLKYGFESIDISPKIQIRNAGERPVLIMHSSEDPEVPFSNFERIMKNAPEHAESWVREGYHHFIVERDSLLNPQNDKEYSERVLQFLNNHFGN
ncbi:alpha/beta hydrolase [Alkaliphilus peptidifermentans]|uniref:Serine aminopeptidase S33 domain-containing protein n=1 Tax=Alkaliphilus peptidifermentans DSM 18978 TaxID=1120976 RepID=A0A1G5H943_9FIRM|nr:alpha/beta fold hydrolase [Alkaliphilus peptidifermentans]SCY60181.1 hypothetical protein SAMN03080606_01915 [Alkaliphilus peptidifermentans DSM 18978]